MRFRWDEPCLAGGFNIISTPLRRVRSSLRASAAWSPLEASALRSSLTISHSSNCERSTVWWILSMSRFLSSEWKWIERSVLRHLDPRPGQAGCGSAMEPAFFWTSESPPSWAACLCART